MRVGLEAADWPRACSTPLNLEGIERPDLGPLAKLPPFKPVVLSMLRLFDHADVTVGEIADMVQSDPAVASELLAVVNSPLFAVQAKVTDTGHAITMLGIDRAKSLVSSLAMRAMIGNAPKTPVVRRLRMHTVATAAIAQVMAPEFRVAPALAHTAGIIHDLGRMGLLAAHPPEYAAFALRTHEGIDTILAEEQAQFGMDHCQAGLLLAKAWGLPKVFCRTVACHHEPASGQDVQSAVQLSCRLADDFMFQAILHRSSHRPIETIELYAPEGVRRALCDKLGAMEGRVIDAVQSHDF